MDRERWRMGIRCVLRGVGWLVIAVAMALLVLLGGGYVFARSSAGERWLASTVQEAARAAGLSLTLGSMVIDVGFGSQQVILQDVVLADENGPWLTASQLGLVTNVWVLRSGLLVVNELSLIAPHWERLPVSASPSAPDNSKQEPLPNWAVLMDWLSVVPQALPSVLVERVRVEQGLVQPAVWSGDGEPVALSALGNANFSRATGLGFSLRAQVQEAISVDGANTPVRATAVALEGRLLPDGSIQSHVQLDEPPSGFAAKLARVPDLFGTVKLNGELSAEGVARVHGEMAVHGVPFVPVPASVESEASGSEQGTQPEMVRGTLRAEAQGGVNAVFLRSLAVSLPWGTFTANGNLLDMDKDLSATVRGEAHLGLTPEGVQALSTVLALPEQIVQGEVQATLIAEGVLLCPDVTLSLTVPHLAVGEGPAQYSVDALHAKLSSRVESTALSATKGTLFVEGQVQKPQGGAVAPVAEPAAASVAVPVRVAAAWEADSLATTVRDLVIQAAGVDITGTLRVGYAPSLALDGVIRATVGDWSNLSRVAGIAVQARSEERKGAPEKDGTNKAQAVTGVENVILTLTSAPKGHEQKATLAWTFPNLAVGARGEVLSAEAVSGEASVRDIFGAPCGQVRLHMKQGQSGDLRWDTAQLRVEGTPSTAQIHVESTGDVAVAVQANYADQQVLVHSARLRAQWREGQSKVGLRLERPMRIDGRSGLAVRGMALAVQPTGNITLDGSVQENGTMRWRAAVSQLPLALARLVSDAPLPHGVLNGTIDIHGSVSRPQGGFALEVGQVAYAGTSMPQVALRVTGKLERGAASGALRLEASITGLGPQPAQGWVRVPLRFDASGMPLVVTQQALSGTFQWAGPLESLWRFVPVSGQRVRGTGHANLTVTGTAGAPDFQGEVVLEGAVYEDLLLGFTVAPVNARAQLHGQGAVLELSAGDGRKGLFTAHGSLGSAAEGFPLDVQGSLRDFAPLRRGDVHAVFSGTVGASGRLVAPHIRADIVVNSGELRLAELPGGGFTVLDVVEKGYVTSAAASTPALAVPSGKVALSVMVPNRFFVRGHGVDSEWQGRVRVEGPLTTPAILGDLRSIRGTLSLLGKTFRLEQGLIMFDGALPPNPVLDIRLQYETQNLIAEAVIAGVATRPRLTLESRPPLPQDEVVSQVLFGRNTEGLSRFEAVQLAASVASLAGFGTGGLGVLELTRDLLGVDVLRVGNSQKSTRAGQQGQSPFVGGLRSRAEQNEVAEDPTLEVGKYVLDNVYAGVEQGLDADSSAVRIEVELAPNINLEARTSSRATDVGVNWKKDY